MAKRSSRRPPASLSGTVLPFELGQDGLAVSTTRGRLVIAGGVVGDRVELLPGRAGSGRVLRVVEPAADRGAAPCAVLGRCGACTLQEMSYRAQLAAKSAALRRGMAALDCDPARLADVVGLEHPFGYRTRLLMPAAELAGGLRFGFYRRGTLALQAAEGCPVQHPLTLGTLAMARQTLDAHEVRASVDDGKDGWLHALRVRVDPGSGGSELVLAARSGRIPGGQALVEQLARLPGVQGVHLSVSPRRSSYPTGAEFSLLAGASRTRFSIGGQRIGIGPATFLQSSAEGAERLVEQVGQLLPQRFGVLADLYGGAGILALSLGGRWRRAVVLEESPSAIADLRAQLELDDPGQLLAICGRVEQRIGEVLAERPDVVLLDPPRRGCKPPVLDALAAEGPGTVVYVACGFESLLRDGQRLLAGGYSVDAVRAVDMFPHTTHLEVIARFVR